MSNMNHSPLDEQTCKASSHGATIGGMDATAEVFLYVFLNFCHLCQHIWKNGALHLVKAIIGYTLYENPAPAAGLHDQNYASNSKRYWAAPKGISPREADTNDIIRIIDLMRPSISCSTLVCIIMEEYNYKGIAEAMVQQSNSVITAMVNIMGRISESPEMQQRQYRQSPL